MANQNPQIAEQLRQAREELARLKAEKARLFPPNPHPFVEPDSFPNNYTPDQIQYRNQLVNKIENLEQRIEDLEGRLFTK